MSEKANPHPWEDTITNVKTSRTFFFKETTPHKLFVHAETSYQKDGIGFVYTVILEREKSMPAMKYNLLNLGIQGLGRCVMIPEVKGANILFQRLRKKPQNQTQPSEQPAPMKIRGPYPAIRQPKDTSQRIRQVHPEGGGMDKDRIWYISFDGCHCELKIIAFIPKKDKPDSDWAPPPPDPGGEYGEDEAGDPDEEDGEEGDPTE